MPAKRPHRSSKSRLADNVADHSPERPSPQRLMRMLLPLILIWVAAIHTSGIYGDFVMDDKLLTENSSLQRFGGFAWFRFTNRPVTMSTFAANFTLFGPTPLSCHLVNIFIHVASVACLFVLVERSLLLLKTDSDRVGVRVIAGGSALLWGVHPLTTSAVTYLIQRGESLASLWMLLCLLCWSLAFGGSFPDDQQVPDDQRFPKPLPSWAWAAMAVASAYLAYGSKQMSASLPLIVLLYDRAFLAESWRETAKRAGWYSLLVVPLILAALLVIPTLMGAGSGTRTVGFDVQGISAWSYFVSQPRVFLQYLFLSLLPVWQSLDYGWLPPRDALSQWLGAIGWLIIGMLLVVTWRRSRPLGFLFAAALLVLSVTSTFIPFQDTIFEHRFYLPMACLVVGLLATRCRWTTGESARGRYRGLVIACVLAIPLSWLTSRRNLDYASAVRIHEVDVDRRPDNPRAWYALATTAVFDRPEPKIAMLHHAIEMSIARDYFYAGTDYKWPRDLADTMFVSGQIGESREYYEMALGNAYDDQQRTEMLYRLAMVASLESRVEDAEELFQQALAGDKRMHDEIQKTYAAHKERLKRARQ